MRNLRHALTLSLAVVIASLPAQACPFSQNIDLNTIKHASVVVVGRVSNYEIVLDQAARQRRNEFVANYPNLSPEARKLMSERKSFGGDYARFQVLVDRVLLGQAPRSITVTWNNSTFAEPKRMRPGPFLIALWKDRSPPQPKPLTVLQMPCAPPFIFKHESANARAVREMLSQTRQ
jgi:hypothetical protein